MILFECPYCAAELEIGESRAGRVDDLPPLQRPGRGAQAAQAPAARGIRPGRGRRGAARIVGLGGTLTAADIEALEEDEGPRKKKRRRPKMEWQLFVGGFGFPLVARRRDALAADRHSGPPWPAG